MNGALKQRPVQVAFRRSSSEAGSEAKPFLAGLPLKDG